MLPSWLPPTYVPECLLLACWGLGLATLWPLCSSQLRRPVTDVEPQRRFGPLRRILAVRIGSPRRISHLCRQAAKSLAPVVVTPAAIVAITRGERRWYLNVVLASFTNHHWRECRAHEPLFSLILENGHFGRFWVGQRKPLWEELGGLAHRSVRDMGGDNQSGLKVHPSSMRRRVYPDIRYRGPEKRSDRIF